MLHPDVEVALASGRRSLIALAAGDFEAFELSMAHHERDCRALENLPVRTDPEVRQSLEEIIAIDSEIMAAAARAAGEALQRMGVLRRASQANTAYANTNSPL